MAELNKGSAIANKSWSSEKEIADADIEKELSMLSPEIQGIWKNIENKRVEGKSQTSHARSLLKKEGVAAQEKTKLESDLETLDERDAAFEDIGDIILREKNPRGILKAIQNLSNT